MKILRKIAGWLSFANDLVSPAYLGYGGCAACRERGLAGCVTREW